MASELLDRSLAERLAEALPSKAAFKFYHISTPPTRAPALYSAPPGAKPEKTYLESHFLNVSITKENGEELLVLAIEVLVYTTRRLTTIFVSKADSTGYLSLLGLSRAHASPLRTIATEFLDYIVEKRQRKGVRLVLSLFARASDQYLFPGSVENKSKHVSDDRQLVKWWCRVLNPILQKYNAALGDTDQQNGSADHETVTSQAYLIVPGEDSIVPYLPQNVRLDPTLRKRWHHGHPLREIAKHPAAPPRCLVPHFPDDPKARFLVELDDELPDSTTSQSHSQDSPSKKRGNGHWRSVRSLEQFWEMMAFRQECSSGRLVGFIWLVFTPPDIAEDGSQEASSQSQQESQGTTAAYPAERTPRRPSSSPSKRRRRTVPRRKKKPLRGPIVPRTPKIKSASSSAPSLKPIPEETAYYFWPTSSRASVLLSERDYKKATERLLALQFRSEDAAVASTKTWVGEVAVLAGLEKESSWAMEVVGRKEGQEMNGPEAVGNGGSIAANVGVKRKANDAPAAADGTGVTTLGEGLVKKKKKKIQPQQV